MPAVACNFRIIRQLLAAVAVVSLVVIAGAQTMPGSTSPGASTGAPAAAGAVAPVSAGRGLTPFTAEKPRSAHRIALCVGIDNYDSDRYHKLTCCVADAKALAETFKKLGYEVTLMTDDSPDSALKPTYENLDRQLYKICKAASDPNDTLVITYAGHGDLVGQQSGLLPLDYGSKPTQVQRLITIGSLLDDFNLDECRAAKKLLVLDACRSAAQNPDRLLATGFLQSFGQPKNFLLLTGCGANQSSVEENGHGRLTQMLLDGLNGAAYETGKPFLMADQLCSYVQSQFLDKGWAKLQSPERMGRLTAAVKFDLAQRMVPPPPLTTASKKLYAEALGHFDEAWKQNDYTSCVDYASAALTLWPNQPDALALRALANQALGYRDFATRDARAGLALEPNQAVAMQVLALQLYAENKTNNETLPTLLRVEKLVAQDGLRWKRLAAGENAAPRLRAIALMLAYEKVPRYEEAAVYCTRIIELKDASVNQIGGALVILSYCHGKHGDIDSAIADCTRLVHLKTAPGAQVASALINRAVCYVQKGDLDQAIADCSQAIDLKDATVDQVAMALVNREAYYVRQGNLDKAIADCTRAIGSRAASARLIAIALIDRAVCYANQGRLQQAIADCTRAIDLRGVPAAQLAKATMNRGRCYYQTDDIERAMDDSARAAALDKSASMPRYNMGLILVRQSKFDEARKKYAEALAIDKPGDAVTNDLVELRDKLKGPPETTAFLGWMKIEAGQSEDGQKDLQAYLKEHPGGPMAARCRALLKSAATEPKPTKKSIDAATSVTTTRPGE